MNSLYHASLDDVQATQNEMELAQFIHHPLLIKYTEIDHAVALDKQKALRSIDTIIQSHIGTFDTKTKQTLQDAISLYKNASKQKRDASEQLPWDALSYLGKRKSNHKKRKSKKRKSKKSKCI